MKKYILIAGLFLVALCSNVSAEGTSQYFHVVEIELNKDYGNFIFIKTDRDNSDQSTKAPCSTHKYWEYTLPLVTEFDKAAYNIIMTALTESKEVILRGDETHCYEFGNVESLQSIRIRK